MSPATRPVAKIAAAVLAPVLAGCGGRVMWVPYSEPAIGAALSFNTVLSIPYAIDQFVPLLEKS